MLFTRCATKWSILVKAHTVSQMTSPNIAKQQQRRLHLQLTDAAEEMDDETSQNSSKESICSLPEFDIGDETTASQETTATEVTRTAGSWATFVRKALCLLITLCN